MEFAKGMVVKSVQGHDKGEHYLVVATDERFVYLANGKNRKLAGPKKKNKRHVVSSEQIVDLQAHTDKTVRKLINRFNNAVSS